MENLMIKAIRLFKKEHKNGEIRNCSAWESSGSHGKVTYAMFNIEYVEESGGEYKSVQYQVYKD